VAVVAPELPRLFEPTRVVPSPRVPKANSRDVGPLDDDRDFTVSCLGKGVKHAQTGGGGLRGALAFYPMLRIAVLHPR
jgi:hypothetical protein